MCGGSTHSTVWRARISGASTGISTRISPTPHGASNSINVRCGQPPFGQQFVQRGKARRHRANVGLTRVRVGAPYPCTQRRQKTFGRMQHAEVLGISGKPPPALLSPSAASRAYATNWAPHNAARRSMIRANPAEKARRPQHLSARACRSSWSIHPHDRAAPARAGYRRPIPEDA